MVLIGGGLSDCGSAGTCLSDEGEMMKRLLDKAKTFFEETPLKNSF